MAVNLQIPEVEPREQRLGSVISFHGTASECYDKCRDKGLHMRDRSFSQNGGCSSSTAFTTDCSVRDVAVVLHAPIGCAGDFGVQSYNLTLGSAARGLPVHNLWAICTNLSERDTVYGAADKLRDALREAYTRFNPKLIFLHTSCVSGIIGEDIESIAEEVEEELGVIIAPVYCEGFRSKIWSTGFDATAHAIMRKVAKPVAQKSDNIINVFNFQGSHTFNAILGKLGLVPRYLFPFATVEDLENMPDALATTHICETLGTYVSAALEEEYGVPEIKAPTPYGLEWTDRWLREIARVTGREHLVEDVIASEHERIEPQLQELRSFLSGKTVYVLAGDSYVHSIVSCCRSFGMKIAGGTSYHHDQVYDNDYGEVNSLGNMIHITGDVQEYTICNKQPYEFISLLRDAHPDIAILRHNQISTVVNKLGIPSFMISDPNQIIAYDGLIEFGKRVAETIQSGRLVKNIARHTRFPYTEWWLSKNDPFYYERGEANG
ncbi:MAG: nitrogenase [Peptococcaceae bacterium]|jgi:nitrogenase molybdenum-iron protein alpha chain|nr:nitrogenase [Peptococcaceae bacterium]